MDLIVTSFTEICGSLEIVHMLCSNEVSYLDHFVEKNIFTQIFILIDRNWKKCCSDSGKSLSSIISVQQKKE